MSKYIIILYIGMVSLFVACNVSQTDRYPTLENDERLQDLNKRLCEDKGKVWDSKNNKCNIK